MVREERKDIKIKRLSTLASTHFSPAGVCELYMCSVNYSKKFGNTYKLGNCHKSDLLLLVGLPILGALSY